MVHLKHRLASIVTLFLFVMFLCGCDRHESERKALVEANPLSSGYYHIELSGSNGLALLAYKTDVLAVGNEAQWDGLAVIGAYEMAFQQECHSLYSPTIHAKQWRGLWVEADITTPTYQLQEWLQLCLPSSAEYDPTPVPIRQVLPMEQGGDTEVVSIHLRNAPLNWKALCDAHIDTWFGSQTLLTDHTQADVTLYFHASTKQLLGVVFTAENSQGYINGSITLSTAYGHTMQEFPSLTSIIVADENGESYALLYEEWDFYQGS